MTVYSKHWLKNLIAKFPYSRFSQFAKKRGVKGKAVYFLIRISAIIMYVQAISFFETRCCNFVFRRRKEKLLLKAFLWNSICISCDFVKATRSKRRQRILSPRWNRSPGWVSPTRSESLTKFPLMKWQIGRSLKMRLNRTKKKKRRTHGLSVKNYMATSQTSIIT